ncbi:unnamed protein product [Orchesella dallaii]|uniref:Uncharacterized protein n=1 Tax=Orchesella dallaii TaxID=48710 RepID=A0ABP1RQG0_9HEXA
MTTNDDLMAYLKKEFLSLNTDLQRIQDSQNDMQMRMTTMETNIQAISDSSKAHDEAIEEIREDVNTLRNAHINIMEQNERLMKRSKLVVFNIPEDENAVEALKTLTNVILPGNELPIKEHRIGKKRKRNDNSKIRPLRVHLNNQNEVIQALSNCKNLKEYPEFTKVGVIKDLTKLQQEQRKNRPAKRNAAETYDQNAQPIQKFGRNEHEKMEN